MSYRQIDDDRSTEIEEKDDPCYGCSAERCETCEYGGNEK